MNRFVAGALAGTIATVPMTMVMGGLFRRLPSRQRYPLPPREIMEKAVLVPPQGRDLNDEQLTWITLTAHFTYGAFTGALYPLVVDNRRHLLLRGGGYGLAIWAASYLGWIPAAHILKPASQHPARRNAVMLCAHWVWGATTVTVGERLRRCYYWPGTPTA